MAEDAAHRTALEKDHTAGSRSVDRAKTEDGLDATQIFHHILS